MPTYSYRCTACGDEFDIRQSFTDEALKVCEKCGGQLRKLFNSVGIVFKGSGFYHNDAKSSSGALQAKTKKPEGHAEASGSADSVSSTSPSPTATPASTPSHAGSSN